MKLHELSFKRKFSINPYQSLKLPVGEMSMNKDWISDRRGDPYPVLNCSGEFHEQIEDASYTVSSDRGGEVSRLLGSFFPYYTYAFRISDAMNCDVGVVVRDGDGEREITVMLCDGNHLAICAGEEHWDYECFFRCGDEAFIKMCSICKSQDM